MTALLPWLAIALFLALTAALVSGIGRAWRGRWLVPAILSVAFAAFSVLAVLREGPLGFWPEHTRNLWGNQIWFDLLLAVGVAWACLMPRVRALGMRPWPWLLLVVCTGSIGLCAMVARVLYLEEAKGNP